MLPSALFTISVLPYPTSNSNVRWGMASLEGLATASWLAGLTGSKPFTAGEASDYMRCRGRVRILVRDVVVEVPKVGNSSVVITSERDRLSRVRPVEIGRPRQLVMPSRAECQWFAHATSARLMILTGLCTR